MAGPDGTPSAAALHVCGLACLGLACLGLALSEAENSSVARASPSRPPVAEVHLERFAIPNEIRGFAGGSVAQAHRLDGFLPRATNQAMGRRASRTHGAAQEITQKSMTCVAERSRDNLSSRKAHAHDAAELMGLQHECVPQIRDDYRPVQDLGRRSSGDAMEVANVSLITPPIAITFRLARRFHCFNPLKYVVQCR